MADMQQGPPLVSMAEQFSGLPMKDLIGAPLMAAAEANGAMAVAQAKFLIDTCFHPVDESKEMKDWEYKPVMIEMILERSIIDPASEEKPEDPPKIETFETKFKLPLLTILPLNSLAVETVDVSFHMEVKSSYAQTESRETTNKFAAEASWAAKAAYGPFSAEVKGSVSYSREGRQASEQHYEKSNSAEYDVKVHAGQLPLAPGVTTIIQAYANNIQPIVLEKAKGGSS